MHKLRSTPNKNEYGFEINPSITNKAEMQLIK
jgi:hypothetical protein